jgi:copper transporter 1
MLWNWYTVDTCFISSTWHNNTKAKFAGSVIGVFLLVIAIEGLRRLARDYDRRIVNTAMVNHARSVDGQSTPIVGAKDVNGVEGQCGVPFQYVVALLSGQ